MNQNDLFNCNLAYTRAISLYQFVIFFPLFSSPFLLLSFYICPCNCLSVCLSLLHLCLWNSSSSSSICLTTPRASRLPPTQQAWHWGAPQACWLSLGHWASLLTWATRTSETTWMPSTFEVLQHCQYITAVTSWISHDALTTTGFSLVLHWRYEAN